MKKIFIALAAVAALAACTKSEVQYDAPAEIGFAPFAKMSTKAAVADADYPNDLNMYVFANAGTADATADNFTEVYFKNALFAERSAGIFGGSPSPYFWPNVKGLIFSGVSASGNVNKTDGAVPSYAYNNGEWQITLAGYAPGVGTTKLGDNDLMWFPTTKSYTKAEVFGTTEDGDVDVIMKHACSWITINVKGDAITGKADDASTSDIDETTTWKVKSLVINDLSLSGTAVLGAAATWPTLGEANGTFDVFTSETGTALTTNYVALENVANNTIVIPQAPTTLTIVYEYVSQKGAGENGADLVIEETKTVDLTLANTVTGKDENGADTMGGNWLPGVHYTYNIIIGTQEILIEPAAETWTPKEVTPEIAL